MILRRRRLTGLALFLCLAGCADLVGANFDAEPFPGAGGAPSSGVSTGGASTTSTGGAGGAGSSSTASTGGGGSGGGTTTPSCPSTCPACADEPVIFALPESSELTEGFATDLDLAPCGRVVFAATEAPSSNPNVDRSAVVGLVDDGTALVGRLPIGPGPTGGQVLARTRAVHVLPPGDPGGDLLVGGTFAGELRYQDQPVPAYMPTGFVAATSVDEGGTAQVGWATLAAQASGPGNSHTSEVMDVVRPRDAQPPGTISVVGYGVGPSELRRYPDPAVSPLFIPHHENEARVLVAQLRGDGFPMRGHFIGGGMGVQRGRSVDAGANLVVLGGHYEGTLEGGVAQLEPSWWSFSRPGPLPGDTSGVARHGFVATLKTSGTSFSPEWVRGFGRSDAALPVPTDQTPTSGFVVRALLGPDDSVVAAIALTLSDLLPLDDQSACGPLSTWNSQERVDAVIVKLDRGTGRCVWARRLHTPGHDEPRGLAVSPDERIFVTGTYSGTPRLDGAAVEGLGPVNAGSSQGFVLVLDADGVLLEARSYPVSASPGRTLFLPVAATEKLLALGLSGQGKVSMFGLEAQAATGHDAFFLRVPRSTLLP